MSADVSDPFSWEANDEDEARAWCVCGWVGPWRDRIGLVRIDERDHACDRALAWRADR